MTSRAPDPGAFPSEERLQRWVDGLASDDAERARAAFTALDRACRPHLVAAARSFVADVMEAEDVVQDLLARCWMSRQRLQIEGGIRNYLLASIRYECLRVIRWHEGVEELPEEPGEVGTDIDDGGPSRLFGPEEAVHTLELVEWFERALAELSDTRRQALQLKWRELTNAEIAAFLGISINAVKLRISRGCRDLDPFRKRLHDEADDP